MDWKGGFSEAECVAQAQIAPANVVAELIKNYRQAHEANPLRYLAFMTDGSAEFEQSVFDRDDPYLRLLIAGAAVETDIVLKLWDWQESTASLTDTFKKAVRLALLSGFGVNHLLIEKRFGGEGDGRISLAKRLISVDLSEETCAILQNPQIKFFLDDILGKKDLFADIPVDAELRIAVCCSKNPLFNDDKSDDDGPDLSHWSLDRELCRIISDTPVTIQNFYLLDQLLYAMEPEAFDLHDFSFIEFYEKWKKLDFQKSSGEDPAGRFTELSQVDELVSMVCAKFGHTLADKNKPSLAEALKEENLLKRAATLGNTTFAYKDLEKLRYELKSSDLFWLSFNKYQLNNEDSRELIKEETRGSLLGALFQSRLLARKTAGPGYSRNEQGEHPKTTPNSNEALLFEKLEQIERQTNQVKNRIDYFENQLKTLFYICVAAFVIWQLKGFFS
jgi:hypothetical protein